MLSEYKLFPMNDGFYFDRITFFPRIGTLLWGVALLLCCTNPLFAQQALQDTAWAFLDRGDNLGAQKFVENTLAKNSKLKPREKADLLNAKAVALRRNGDPRRAITVHYLALNYRLQSFGEQSLPVARSWQNIANCWIDLAEQSKAAHALQKALRSMENKHDLDLKVKILQGLGGVHQGQKHWDQAINYHQQALQALESHYAKQDPILQNALINLAQCYLDNHQPKAAAVFIQRLDQLKKAPTAPLFALRLSANSAQQTGDLERTTRLLRLALAQWEQQVFLDQGEWLHVLSDLSSVLEQKGELDEAALLFTQVLYKLEKKPDLKAFEASVHNNYANLLRSWGRDSLAIFHYDQALGLFSTAQTQELNAVYLNLAAIYLQAGDPAFAQVYLDLITTVGVPVETTVVAQLIRGQVHEKLGNFQLAKDIYAKIYATLLASHQDQYPELFANVSIRLAQTLAREHIFGRGIILLNKALQSLGQTTSLQADLRPSETSELLNALAALTLRQARAFPAPATWKKTWYAHRRAIGFMQRHQQKLVGKYSLLLAGSNARETFEGILEVCYERSKSEPSFAKEAFIYADMSKALLLRRLMQEAHAKSFAGVAPADVEREQRLQASISQLNSALRESNQGTQRSRVEAELAGLESQKQRLIRELEKKYPAYHQLKYASPRLSFLTLQKGLKPEQSLLAYFLAEKYLYVFALDQQQFHFKRLRLEPNFFQLLDSCYALLISPPALEDTASLYALNRQSNALYKYLVRPVETHLRPKVTIIPDAQLHYLPFDALLYAEANHLGPMRNFPFLLKRHAIHYASSATLLNLKPTASSRRSFYLAVAPRFSRGLQGLNPLPNARSEIERIALGFSSKKLLQGEAADEQAFTKLAPRASVIHLATHGIVDNKQPDLSYLAFADHRAQTTATGRLTAAEVYGLRLQADLVFLSACQTGLGQWYASEGMLSLSRAFYYAGAKSLVATLWSIPDNQTAQVAEHFYTELHQNLPKDLALQKAKLKYLRGAHSIRAHPAYWAAFTLSGDLSPLPRPGLLHGWTIWLLGVLLLVLGAWWYRHKLPLLRNRNA